MDCRVLAISKEDIVIENKMIHYLKNSILIGDSLSDIYMTRHLKGDCVLKIGFFNSAGRSE